MTDDISNRTDQAPEDIVEPAAPPDRRRWLALAVIGMAQLMVILDASIVNIALPSAQAELGISDADRQWVLTAYTLAFGGLLLLGGRIADYWGRKRTFLVGLLGFAAASALGGIAPNAGLLFAARGLQGAFGALLAPAALALIAVTFVEPKERARAFGVFGAISGGGAAIGLVLGGILTEYFSWRWCLGVNVPIAIAVFIAAIPIITESKAQGDTRYDIPGAVLATAGLVSLVYGFTQAAKPDVGWTAGSTIAFFVASVVLLAAFLVVESRVQNPMLPLWILRDRNRGGSYLIFLLVGAGLFAMFLFLTFYLQVVLGYSPLKSGYAFLPFSGGIILAAGVVAQLLPRTGPKPLILVGLIMSTASMLWLTQITPGNDYVSHVLPAMIIMSIGMAGVFIPAASLALVGVGGHDAGIASAVLNTSQQIGGSLGVALLNTLYASAVTDFVIANQLRPVETPFGPQPPNEALVHGYTVAFFWASMLLLAALVCATLLINARKDDIPAEGAMAAAAA
jgi:EmrB/QacA subfamily drug resistance transporter